MISEGSTSRKVVTDREALQPTCCSDVSVGSAHKIISTHDEVVKSARDTSAGIWIIVVCSIASRTTRRSCVYWIAVQTCADAVS